MQGKMVQRLAAAGGGLFVALGVLSMIPGITTKLYADLAWWGAGSKPELFGLFQTSWLLIISYLVLGVVGLSAATEILTARAYLWGATLVLLAAWVYGVATANDSSANVVPFNRADDMLHFGLAMVYLVAIWALGLRESRPTIRRHVHA